eukprot:137760-Pyramimonas_sp.AAC.1
MTVGLRVPLVAWRTKQRAQPPVARRSSRPQQPGGHPPPRRQRLRQQGRPRMEGGNQGSRLRPRRPAPRSRRPRR